MEAQWIYLQKRKRRNTIFEIRICGYIYTISTAITYFGVITLPRMGVSLCCIFVLLKWFVCMRYLIRWIFPICWLEMKCFWMEKRFWPILRGGGYEPKKERKKYFGSRNDSYPSFFCTGIPKTTRRINSYTIKNQQTYHTTDIK